MFKDTNKLKKSEDEVLKHRNGTNIIKEIEIKGGMNAMKSMHGLNTSQKIVRQSPFSPAIGVSH